ncbi:MAG: lipid A deacylase LpxR family protein [Verrucomicrobia bacterium]|nr:lipid A deacylase LpxR family protein [Verrucomicrobiota bacterium]
MKSNLIPAFALAWMLLDLGVVVALGEMVRQGAVFTLIEENDLFVNTDRHYTQGIRLSFLHTDGFFPFGLTNVYSKIPEWGFRSEVGKFGYAIGQNIYTPADISATEPQVHDRPYAGWLYIGAIFQRRGWSLWDQPAQEDLELDVGVVGPGSLAKDAQIWVHEVRAFDVPRGWHHQLKNEPGLRIKYQRSVRFPLFRQDDFAGEFSPHAGFSLGNVETSFRAGGNFRMGIHLADDFGVQTIDSLGTSGSGLPTNTTLRSRWSVYIFAGAEGRTVAHNVFLDGNLFHDGPSIPKEILVGDFKMGFGLAYRRVEAGYTYVWRTPEFKGQLEEDAFGAVFIRWRF